MTAGTQKPNHPNPAFFLHWKLPHITVKQLVQFWCCWNHQVSIRIQNHIAPPCFLWTPHHNLSPFHLLEPKIVWSNFNPRMNCLGMCQGPNGESTSEDTCIHNISSYWLHMGKILTHNSDGFHSCPHQLSFRHGASSSGSLWACLEWFTKIWRNSSSLVSFSSPAQV